jgi:hypothetical protein
LFYVRVLTADGDMVSLPNNLMLQKAVVRHGDGGATSDEGNGTPA